MVMRNFTDRLHAKMESELQITTTAVTEEPARSIACFSVVEKATQELKEFLKDYEFSESQEEILFFKEIKPRFSHLLDYYGEVAYIMAERPSGDRKTLIQYFRKVIAHNRAYMNRHKILHSYYKLDRSSEDNLLFRRYTNFEPLYPEYSGDMDTSFSTISSKIFSKLMAFEKLNDMLANEIEKLKRRPISSPGEKKKTKDLVWTDSKANLVELGYSIYNRGSVNYGKAELADIMLALEMVFQVQIGNYYRIYVDLCSRKKSRTPYLDSLKENMERRMDERL